MISKLAGKKRCDACGGFFKSLGQHKRHCKAQQAKQQQFESLMRPSADLQQALKDSLALEEKPYTSVEKEKEHLRTSLITQLTERRDRHFHALETINRMLQLIAEEGK